MAVTGDETAVDAAADPSVVAEDHAIGALSLRTLAPQILTGGVAPFVVYQIGRHFGLADDVALALSAVPPAVSVLVSWAWKRRLDPIGAIALISIVAGLAAMVFMNGSEVLFKMRESVVTGAFGVICLVSLVTPGKPAMFVMGRALTADAGKQHVAGFDELWEQPRARRVFILLTLVWGVGLVAEATVRALLVYALPTGTFLAVTPVLFWVVLGSLLYFTVTFVRSSRRRAAAELATQTAS
ncbi:MAG TPA: VC0807 family protein [Acidimicrobiales bacterium]|nr:VC0807 family protein [Acidimicrobiales bacterium]